MESRKDAKKHPCRDCVYCQWCSNDRCNLCLKHRGFCSKLSLAEQIELYDALNSTGKSQIDLE